MKILITNIASVTAISIVKILKKGKITDLHIWGTEAQKYGYNSGSMIADHYIQVSEVSSDFYVHNIIDICQKYNIDVLVPILDEELYLFSKFKLQDYVKILLPEIRIIKLFRNKLLGEQEFKKYTVKDIYKDNSVNFLGHNEEARANIFKNMLLNLVD